MDTAELRPYYNEDTFDAGYLVKFNPQKGVVDSNGFNIASKLSIVKNSNSSAKNLDPATLFTTRSNSKGSLFNFSLNFGSRAKALKGSSGSLDSLVKEFEWVDLLNVNKWIAVVSQLMELFVRKYFQLLIQQPFEVSRLLQQVGQFNGESVSHTEEQKKARLSGIILSDLDNEDEINYFPSTSTPDLLRDGTDNDERDDGEDQYTGQGQTDSVASIEETHIRCLTPERSINPESKHTLDIMNSILDEEGIKGLWKANNTNFIYQILSSTLEAWYTGLISPLLHIPDPYFIDLIHFPDTQSAVLLTLSVGVLTALTLIPIDLIRTRFIVTALYGTDTEVSEEASEGAANKKHDSRSLRHWIRSWSWRHDALKLPSDMWLLTMLQSVSNVSFNKLIDLVIYHKFHVDKYSQMTTYNTMKVLARIAELFVKLPIECLLRRCQLDFLVYKNSSLRIEDTRQLIISPVKYQGVWKSIRDKSEYSSLWNGWRVGFMSIVCSYGVKLLNKFPEHTEQEKF